MKSPEWPVRLDEAQPWTEIEIRKMITALRHFGTMNTPTAFYVAEVMEQMLREQTQLITEKAMLEARLCAYESKD